MEMMTKHNRRQATHFQVGSEHEHGTCHPARARAQDQVTLDTPTCTLPHAASRLDQATQSTRVSGIYKASLLSQDGPLPRFGPFAAVTATHSTIVHPQLRVAFFTPPTTITKRIWFETYNFRNFQPPERVTSIFSLTHHHHHQGTTLPSLSSLYQQQQQRLT